MVEAINRHHLPDVAVEYFLVIIVLRLHDLIPHAEHLPEQGFFRLERAGGIERGL